MQVWNVLRAARWKCRSQKIAKNSSFSHHRTTRAVSSQLWYISTIGKKLVKQQYLLHMSSQYGECWPTNDWDRFTSLGHLSNFNGFHVLASLLKRRRSQEANQTLHDVWSSPGLVHYIYNFRSTWHGAGLQSRPHCARWGLSSLKKGALPTQFSAHVYCGQMAGWIKTPLGTEVGDIVFYWDPAPPKKGAQPLPIFGPCLLGQTTVCIRIPHGMEVGLSLGDILLDGEVAPPLLKRHSPQFSAHVHCSQTAGWTKMPLGMEVGVDCVRWGPSCHAKRGTAPSLQPMSVVPNGWMDEDVTWYGSRPGPRPHCVRWEPNSFPHPQ